MEAQVIQNKIYGIRDRRVMLDFDLAVLYGVETRVLKQAVRRNIERFPDDFMFRLPPYEVSGLIYSGVSQIVIPPGYNTGASDMFVFTEQGVSMLSAILRSERAISVSIAIMRAFVAMRNYITTTSTITAELAELRTSIELLKRYGEDTLESVNDLPEYARKEIGSLYEAIAVLSIKKPELSKPRQPIGFKTGKE